MKRSRLRLVVATVLVPLATVVLGMEPPPELALEWSGMTWPEDVAMSSDGYVYVTDVNSHRVQKYSSDGTFQTEWGSQGGADGQFVSPRGVAVAANGDVYVAEQGNHRVQKFSSAGAFLTKWGSYGQADGQFNVAYGIALDVDGNVYVTDTENDRIQKFTSAGVHLATWGSYGTGDGQLDTPLHIAVDAAGNVYVADAGNRRIQKFTSDGDYLTQWGSYGTGYGQFKWPYGVAVDAAGDVYVTDSTGLRVQKFDGEGTFLAIWGADTPLGIAVAADDNIYVAVSHPGVQKFAPPVLPEPIPEFALQWGSQGSGDGQFNYPDGVATDASGNVYVASGNHRMQKFDGDGNFQIAWGSSTPGGVATDGAGHVYVTDGSYHRIRKFDTSGVLQTEWGSYGAGDGQFIAPRGVAVDAAGNVYVTDHGNSRVQKFDSSGTFLTKWGSNGSGDSQFINPRGIAVDHAGNVYVADGVNHRIQKFDSNGAFLAKWGSLGSDAGQFNYPYGVAVDGAGNVYVTDYHNHRVQKFDGDGTYLTRWRGFWYPLGIAVDADRNKVYVGDTAHRVQKFEPPLPLFVGPASPENGSSFDWPAGKLLTFDIKVVDGTADDTVTLEVVESPEGAEVTLASPENPALASLAWTPVEADAGTHVITLRATDEGGHEVTFTFTFTMNVKGDSDGDGLSDLWETTGYTAPNGEFVPLHLMGADPYHKDIFVDVDYMVGEAPNLFGTLLTFDHRPLCAALDEIKAAFAAAPVDNPDGTTGINLHIRVAQQADCSSPSITSRVDFVPVLGSLDASNYLWIAPPGSSVPHFDDLKGAPGIFPEELGYAVHYCVFAHDIAGWQTGMSRGLDAGDFIVSLGSLMSIESALANTPEFSIVTANPEAQAGTFMHELGHNLDLGHGGADGVRQKPNYLSIMNKDYFQMTGLLIDGEFGLIGGDHGSGASRHYHFDYSREALPGWAGNILDEATLDENVGLQGSSAMDRYGTYYYSSEAKCQVNNVNAPIDWDVYLGLDSPISMDVSNLNGINELEGHDDWANLSYTGGRVGGGIVILLPETSPADELAPEEAIEQIQAPSAIVGDLRGHVADKMLHLTWKPAGPGVIYRVYRREDVGGPALVGTTTQTNFKDRDVEEEVVYTYTVKTYDPVHDTESAVAEAVSLQLRR